MTVLNIVEEGLQTHKPQLSKVERQKLSLSTLEKVGL